MTLTFQPFFAELHTFCAVDLSAFYFDVRKDALYCGRTDSAERRAARTVLDTLFNHLTAWLAPVLCFTAEEAWLSRNPDTALKILCICVVSLMCQLIGMTKRWRRSGLQLEIFVVLLQVLLKLHVPIKRSVQVYRRIRKSLPTRMFGPQSMVLIQPSFVSPLHSPSLTGMHQIRLTDMKTLLTSQLLLRKHRVKSATVAGKFLMKWALTPNTQVSVTVAPTLFGMPHRLLRDQRRATATIRAPVIYNGRHHCCIHTGF